MMMILLFFFYYDDDDGYDSDAAAGGGDDDAYGDAGDGGDGGGGGDNPADNSDEDDDGGKHNEAHKDTKEENRWNKMKIVPVWCEETICFKCLHCLHYLLSDSRERLGTDSWVSSISMLERKSGLFRAGRRLECRHWLIDWSIDWLGAELLMPTILSMSWPSGIITYFQKDGTKMALKDWTVLKLKHSCEVWACSTAAGDCELLSSLPRWAPVPLQTSPLRIKPNLSIPLYTIGSKLVYPSTHPVTLTEQGCCQLADIRFPSWSAASARFTAAPVLRVCDAFSIDCKYKAHGEPTNWYWNILKL